MLMTTLVNAISPYVPKRKEKKKLGHTFLTFFSYFSQYKYSKVDSQPQKYKKKKKKACRKHLKVKVKEYINHFVYNLIINSTSISPIIPQNKKRKTCACCYT